ncbi:MAG: TRAP transporter substrate-binding protein DctP [Alphaproteobacteria bacterium]|nr:TRAP transporter substrate-binding protein DctP [Alphaproteobacteria bacterium]
MRKTLLATTSLAIGLALAAGSAMAGDISTQVDEAKKETQVVLDWLDGKLDNYGKNEVSYDGDPIIFRSTSHIPAVSGLAKLQIQGFDNLERMSNGKIKVETTWSQSVHGVREGRKAVRTGLSDQAPCFSLYTARDYNAVGGLGLPFLFNNAHEAVATAEHIYPKYLKDEFERFQVLLMRSAHTGPYHLYNNKPVRTLEDVKGMKVRAGGGVHAQIIGALDATQVSMPGASAYTAMQRGTIDAIHFNDAAALIFKLHEVAKYRTENGFNVLTIEYCMSKDWFDDLPADLQNVVNNWGRQMAIAEAAGFYDYGGLVNVAKMQEQGLETITMSDEELGKWKSAVADVEAAWVADAEKKGVPATEMMKDIRANAAKFKAMSANDVMLDAINNPVQGIYDMK